MGNLEKNIHIFKEYTELQEKIDHCKSLIDDLKSKKKNILHFSCPTLKDNLGSYLCYRIGDEIIKLLEYEITILENKKKSLDLII